MFSPNFVKSASAERMALASLPDVDALSDDERLQQPSNGPHPASQKVAQAPRRRRLPAKRKIQQVVVKEPAVMTLRHKVEGSCGCFAGCFKPFRGELFEQLVKIHKTMCQLEKLDQDNYATTSELQKTYFKTKMML